MSIELTTAARQAVQKLETAYSPLAWLELSDRLPHPNIYDPVILLRPHKIHIADTARIDSFCKLEGGEGIYIGEHVHIASFGHLGIGGGLLIMEDGVSTASSVKVVTGSNVPGVGRSCSAVDPTGVIQKSFVHIKRNAVLFAGSIVLPGITIGEGAVIAAGAVVRCDVPDGEVWAGVPARRVGRVGSMGSKGSVEAERDDYTTQEQRYIAAMREFYGWPR